MKQVLQSLKDGSTEIAEIPAPAARNGRLLVRTVRSLVSAGTERMLVDFGKAGLLQKARQQPDKVRMVFDKIRTDGLMPTFEAVRNKLDQPVAMGYCNVGRVLADGLHAAGFAAGDRVVSNGPHAEIVSVPRNLCVPIPAAVSDDEAAFTVLGAVALQGIRLIAPSLGECVVVTGLGLIGLMAVQLLRAQGCRVLGIDFDPAKLELARSFGADVVAAGDESRVLAAALEFSRGRGVDAVLLTAATQSNEPVRQAARMSRKRGRIVLVGVVGLELSRADFFEKELTFQVSCSYGPGRYDPAYEERGNDYPIGFVRWTEQRNFEAVLDMMAVGALNVRPLISHRFALSEAERAYRAIGEPGGLGVLLEYPTVDASNAGAIPSRSVPVNPMPSPVRSGGAFAFIGAGNYAGAVLAPAFRQAGARLKSIVSNAGVSSVSIGRKHGFEQASTAADAVLTDTEVAAVVIGTRHDTHADYVRRALAAGKHVFVEKPLCLTLDDLDSIQAAHRMRPDLIVCVGFNRRFAPQAVRMQSLLREIGEPKSLILTINAGAIPADHWTQDAAVGGGRIVGEACHYIDLMRFLVGAPVTRVQAAKLGGANGADDRMTFTLAYADGSVGTVHYLANGNKSFPKERVEVFCGGRILQLDNFRKLTGFGWSGFSRMNLWRQDKGQRAMAQAFVAAVNAGLPSPIALDESIETTRVSLDVVQAARA
jgi:predicted dehydrogenase/threonine dehydrogenase-like Zn-dependent dehydrogenase